MSVSTYKEFIAALAAGGTVALSPKAVITITASTEIPKSNTRITSEDPKNPGTLVLESMADWDGPLLFAADLTNLTFDNFIIDGNFSSQGGKSRGKGFFNLCNLAGCKNITIHHMQMHDGGCDGFQFRKCSHIEAYKNTVVKLGHDVFYLLGSNSDAKIYNNDITTFTNSAVRLSYGCSDVTINDNYFHSVFSGGSTGPAIEIDKHGFDDVVIKNNIIENINGAAIWMTGDALNTGSIEIENNVFINTGVYVKYTGYSNAAIVNSNMDGVKVTNCTFIGGNVAFSTFDRDGLSVSFRTTFKNCIFYGASIAAFRPVDAGGYATVINSNFYGNKTITTDDAKSKVTFTNSTFVNPMLTDDHIVSTKSPLYGTGVGYKSTGNADPIVNIDPIVAIPASIRLISSSPDTVHKDNQYIDIGKSPYSTYRSLLYFDLSQYKTSVYKAELQLYWYYPDGKTRINDSIIEVYRPSAWSSADATWKAKANSYFDINDKVCGPEPFATITLDKSKVPDNAYHSIDVTNLVNKYINGIINTGFLLKTKLEDNDYIAFYGESYKTIANIIPKLVITETPSSTDIKVPIIDSRRFKESQKTDVLSKNTYLDIGKSTGAARFQLTFDVSKFTKPVDSAYLMLNWYYPVGKSRLADTIVTAYRPLTGIINNMTWITSAENYDNTISYGSTTIKAAVLPINKYEIINITDLINAYINGTYPNTGVFLKALKEANNYIAFTGDITSNNDTKPYILIKTTETLK